MGVTLKQVAEAAGVSSAAASHVLHGRGPNVRVSKAKAEHIKRMAKELRYVPNALARGLRVQKTQQIGLLFENFAGLASGPLYIVMLLDGVARTIFPRHYRLKILSEFDHDDIYRTLGDGHLDGVIWCKMARDEAMLRQIETCPIPIVAMNTVIREDGPLVPFVACDNAQGIELALDHLYNLGHHSIAFVHEEAEATSPDCVERREAFVAGCKSRGCEAEVLVWDWNMHDVVAWHAQPNRATAVIGWSERCAGKILERATEAGIHVPSELSVVGFDSTPYCDTTTPRLTAVAQPIADMASEAARQLIDFIEGAPLLPSSKIFPCRFDIRGSTARPSELRKSYAKHESIYTH